MQHLLNAHFTSTALANIAARRPAMLYFVFNPEVVAVVVAHDISRGEFVAQVGGGTPPGLVYISAFMHLSRCCISAAVLNCPEGRG